jgi:hypothetical protein
VSHRARVSRVKLVRLDAGPERQHFDADDRVSLRDSQYVGRAPRVAGDLGESNAEAGAGHTHGLARSERELSTGRNTRRRGAAGRTRTHAEQQPGPSASASNPTGRRSRHHRRA